VKGVLTTTNAVTKTIDWAGLVVPYVKELLNDEYTFKPTIRGIFYRAGSDEVIPLTTPVYKGIVKALSTDRKNGVIPMDPFTDNSRQIIDIDDLYWEPIQFVKYYLGKLRDLHKSYYDTRPRWHSQPHYVEVFIEKDAVVGTFQEILEDRQIRIVPNRGWSSITYENDIEEKLNSSIRGTLNDSITGN
jgi:hypothetical protein